jgi:cytochrome c-type biogenesis protein
MTLIFTLYVAGVLTILLPCILPLVPIVVGASVAGRSAWRPLVTAAGMLVSFVAFSGLLQLVLSSSPAAIDVIRVATHDLLFLFGVSFMTQVHRWQWFAALIAAPLFFWAYGWGVILIVLGVHLLAIWMSQRITSRLQQLGVDLQQQARRSLGNDAFFTSFLVGATMGIVWVPCAGPALTFALALVQDEPGVRAFSLLTVYGLGAVTPLLLLGYSGQLCLRSVRWLSRSTVYIKHASGVLFIVTALALQFGLLRSLETLLVQETFLGTFGLEVEERLLPSIR